MRYIITAALALAITACAVTPTQIQQDAQLLATGLSGLEPALATAGIVVPSDVDVELRTVLANVAADATQISAATAPGSATATKLADDVTLVDSLVQPLLPPSDQTIASLLTAAVTIGAELSGSAGATTGGMTLEAARAKLAIGA